MKNAKYVIIAIACICVICAGFFFFSQSNQEHEKNLTEVEKEKTLKELKEYFYKPFKRFVDIHELMDMVHENFIEEAVNIIKIY